MIKKIIQTGKSKSIHIEVWGKNDFELGFFEKEDLNFEIKKYVSQKLNVQLDKVFILNQTHDTIYFDTNDINKSSIPDGDAIFTTKDDEVLIIKTADCMPLFFWSIEENLIGLIHSGWKGTYLGISEKLFLHLSKIGFNTKKINSYLGPCIRKKNYEVSEDLFLKFKKYSDSAIETLGDKKYKLDLSQILIQRFKENEIELNLEDSKICTKEQDEYFSFRRGDLGRNLNIIYRN